ncbi:sensor histidine kinase [Kriegella aquimaris]|nr:sensor histidine kinase [Kriegella aquimaris]
MFNAEAHDSTTFNYSFLSIKHLTRSFYEFATFIFLSSVYSIAIVDKRLLTKKFTNKQLEVTINLIILFFVYHLFIHNAGIIQVFFQVSLYIVFFYINSFLFGPFLLGDKKIGNYLFKVILSYLSIIIITLLIYGTHFLDFIHSADLFNLTIFFIITTILSLTYTYIRLKIKNRERFYNLKLEAQESELNLLKSQVNPHFLFNTLNTLYATALEENALKTSESIAKLANLIRYMQNDIKKNFIPLENEITYLKDYITIQKLRCEVTPEIVTNFKNIEGKIISPGLLIPFVENAFKYGIDPSKPSKLILSVTGEEKKINFECTNSYDIEFKTPYKDRGFGIGITNTKQRLQLIYPKKHTLVIIKEKEVFKVKLSITTID